MKFIRCHIWEKGEPQLGADSEIDVPGFGKVQIRVALTPETTERIRAEVIASLRRQLGQLPTIVDAPEPEVKA